MRHFVTAVICTLAFGITIFMVGLIFNLGFCKGASDAFIAGLDYRLAEYTTTAKKQATGALWYSEDTRSLQVEGWRLEY